MFLSDEAVRQLLEQTPFPGGPLTPEDRAAIREVLAPMVRIGSAYDGDRLVSRILSAAAGNWTLPEEPILERARRIYNQFAPGAFEALEAAVATLPERLQAPAAVCAAVILRPTEARSLAYMPGQAAMFATVRPEA